MNQRGRLVAGVRECNEQAGVKFADYFVSAVADSDLRADRQPHRVLSPVIPPLGPRKITEKRMLSIPYARLRIRLSTRWIAVSTGQTGETILGDHPPYWIT
ncbi:MAG: hypothetical protein ACRDT0_09325, partial [Pseudonocardiaceae bacterium]